jgi:hypothetical protein
MSYRSFIPSVRLVSAAAGFLVSGGGGRLCAQSAGQFVIPGIRDGGGTEFAYWDLFQKPAGTNYNYNYLNPPALAGGLDDEGNASNLNAPRTALVQNGSATCFVTSSGALYDFAATTAFETLYAQAAGAEGEVTNVIFQTQTGGVRFDLNNIRLVFMDGGGASVSLPAQYKALDDPQTGSFAERLVSAFQWDLTGKGVHDFRLLYSAPGTSMPLWQAQLDVVSGAPFVQELGYLLLTSSLPNVRYGRPGVVSKNLPAGAEERFFLPGTTLRLTGEPSPGWAHTGWSFNGVVHSGATLPVTFTDSDLRVAALFAPDNYDDWRDAMFHHSNPVIGQLPDNTNDDISGPEADPDGDGANNFAEFAFGGDPYESDPDRTNPVAGLVEVSGQSHAAVTYREGAGGEFPEITYTVRHSTDLAIWQTTGLTETARVLQVDGSTLVTVRSQAPVPTAPRLFFSIKAE